MTRTRKETKAEAILRMEAEAVASYQKFVSEYPARFAAVMFAGIEHSHMFVVKKVSPNSYSFQRAATEYSQVLLVVSPPVERDWNAVYQLEEAERMVQDYSDEVAEHNRRYAVREAALLKLTREEREILDL